MDRESKSGEIFLRNTTIISETEAKVAPSSDIDVRRHADSVSEIDTTKECKDNFKTDCNITTI